MNVVGHDDEGIKRVAPSIKVPKGIHDHLGAGGFPQFAAAQAYIQPLMNPRGEEAVILLALVFRQCLQLSRRFDAMYMEPCGALCLQLQQLALRQRIREPPGDEISDSRLSPVGELKAVDVHFRKQIQRLELVGHAEMMRVVEELRAPYLKSGRGIPAPLRQGFKGQGCPFHFLFQ